MMKRVLIALSVLVGSQAMASDLISRQVQSEFARIHKFVSSLKPDYIVGGLLKGKNFGDHEILWKLASAPGDGDVIRIYRDKGGNASFEISYYRATHIVPGRTVIRRFVGPMPTGWRNDTIDAITGQYLGMQGVVIPALDAVEHNILRKWGVQLGFPSKALKTTEPECLMGYWDFGAPAAFMGFSCGTDEDYGRAVIFFCAREPLSRGVCTGEGHKIYCDWQSNERFWLCENKTDKFRAEISRIDATTLRYKFKSSFNSGDLRGERLPDASPLRSL